MIAAVKAVHIVSLTIWCAGLLILPALFAARKRLKDEELHDMHRLTRAAFINIVSPAAFVAIIAGTALIFMREVFTVWMAVKLLAVGVLAVIHMREGYVLLTVFDRGRTYRPWRRWFATSTTVAVISVILGLVLAKPRIDFELVPEQFRQAGGLQSLLETMMPMP